LSVETGGKENIGGESSTEIKRKQFEKRTNRRQIERIKWLIKVSGTLDIEEARGALPTLQNSGDSKE